MTALIKFFSEKSIEETAIINMSAFICMSLNCICDKILFGWIGFVFASVTLLFNIVGIFYSNKISSGEERVRIFRRRVNQLIFSICYDLIFLIAFVRIIK